MASAYLTRSTGTPDSRTKFTLSAWFKPSLSSSGNGEVFGFYGSNDYFAVRTQSSSALDIILYDNSTIARKGSTRKFRDCSGFYHILVALDTSLSTAEDRIKIYINNERITDFTNDTNFSQDAEVIRSSMATVGVGTNVDQNGDRANFDGIITHAHYCDGYAYSPTDFGSTDSTTGIWKPKTSPSVSYGTAGFFLDFADSSAMGNDVSGNNNDLTVSGTITQTIDTPSNVFCTGNPLDTRVSFAPNFSNGNLTIAGGGSGTGDRTCRGTLGFSKGKYYWEVKYTSNSSGNSAWQGIINSEVQLGQGNTQASETTNSVLFNLNGGELKKNGTTIATYSGAVNDIFGFAYDLDAGTLKIHKNGTYFNSGNAVVTSISADTYLPYFAPNSGSSYVIMNPNFGNGYFGTTAVASAGTNAGIGTFEYDVPSGYKALCTKNINAQEYS